MTEPLPLDIARCNGARQNNDVDGEHMPPCMKCRRTEMPEGKNIRYLVISAPLFKAGQCPKQIK